ncbi:MAG: hypothetical protein M1455_11140 [Actinobacteria bacterium]|nr:hypothetical protein [Actinomycetota bacterium]
MRRESKIETLSQTERAELINRLHRRQDGLSYISGKPIDLQIDKVDVDHIVSLDRHGPDDEVNWGLVLESENRSKKARDLQLMRYIYQFRAHKEQYLSIQRDFTLGDALQEFFPNRIRVKAEADNEKIQILFNEDGETQRITSPLIADGNDSSIVSFSGLLPFSILFHDSIINPRTIVDLEPLIEEFYVGNPQLQPSLGILNLDDNEEGEIRLFDGQHKAAAQLYIRNKSLYVRVFVNANEALLKRTNFRAHTSLAQIHFPHMITDKVGHDLFTIDFEPYLEEVDWHKANEKSFLNRPGFPGGSIF